MLVPENQECASYPEPFSLNLSPAQSPQSNTMLDLQNQHFAASHVTLEALENTKVAVAQFAATALANGANAASLKDLARLHSTLHTLQHQQMFQINLIHELQSKVAMGNEEAQQNPTEIYGNVNVPDETAAPVMNVECQKSEINDW